MPKKRPAISDRSFVVLVQNTVQKNVTNCFSIPICRGEKTRTSGLHVPNVARCQLRYTPNDFFVNFFAKVVKILRNRGVMNFGG